MEWKMTNNSLCSIFAVEKNIINNKRVATMKIGRNAGWMMPHTVYISSARDM